MIYCTHNLNVSQIIFNYSKLLVPSDFIIIKLDASPTLSIKSLSQNEDITALKSFSEQLGVTIIIYSMVMIKKSSLLTSIIIENGQFISTSSQIFAGNSPYNSINFCNSDKGLIGIVLGNDILYTDLWRIYKVARPKFLFFLNSSNTTPTLLTMSKALSIACNTKIISIFNDQTFSINSNGTIGDIQSGNLRLFSGHRTTPKPFIGKKNITVKVLPVEID